MADFDPIAEHWTSTRTQWTGGPLDRKEAWKVFSMDCAQWHLRGYGMWVVEDKATGKTAGWVGFYEPDHYDETEIGWVLLEEFEGKGLAEEAVRATRTHGECYFGIKRPCSFIAIDNQRSVALAERVGATLEEKRDRGNGPFFVYRHPAPEVLQ
ncbi:MAG: GNAT family N-acetyltransferase [Silicimonas sp.]|nr:GNAT family N-acetyltransferase [Silicimonas sp.]